MAVETTDYPAVLRFLHETVARKADVSPPEAAAKHRDGQLSASWIREIALGLSAAIASQPDPGQPVAGYRVFTAGWDSIEGVMILQPVMEHQADLRAALIAGSERALRDLLRAFPPGKVGLFAAAAEWMLAALPEFFEGERTFCPVGPTSPDPVHCFRGIKRGTRPVHVSPAGPSHGRAGSAGAIQNPNAQRAPEIQDSEVEEISSSKDPVLPHLRALAQSAGRREHSQFMVEAERLVHRAIADGLPVELLVFTPELQRTTAGMALLQDARERSIRHFRISEGLMGKVTSTRPVPTAAAAVFTQYRDAAEFRIGPGTTLLLAEAVNNPENLGLVLRTADAAGVEGVVVVGGRSDPYQKLCVRAARGAVGRIPILACSDPQAYLRRLREEGFRILGATARSEASLYAAEMEPPLVVVVGNEQDGISPALLETCTERVKIPMAPGQSSLNVAVAAGVLLYEIVRQRSARRGSALHPPAPLEPVQL